MKTKSLLLIVSMWLSSIGMAFAQTTMVQTSTDDFVKGTCLYTAVANDGVALQYQMSSFDDWSATTNLPQTLKGHQMVTWRNYVYLLGGTTNGTNTVNTVYRATQEANGVSAWTSLTAMPVALKDMAVVATQTQLIVMGGRNGNGVSDKIYSAPLNDDGSIGTWKELTLTLAQPCWGMRAVMALDNIYIIGGATADDTDTPTDKVYCLKLNADGEINSMQEVNSLPEARNGHAALVYDSKLVVTGGYDAVNNATNMVYSAAVNLDGSLGQWQVETPLPIALFNHTVLCTNGVIAVMGGQDANMPSNRIYCTVLDGTAFSWDLSDIMLPERITEGAAFAYGTKVFFGGGQTLSGTLYSGLSYMTVNTTTEPVQKAGFIGLPYDIGVPKNIQQLAYTLDYTSSNSSYEILYRMAGYDKVFGNWISAGSNLPVVINQSMSHVQYMFRFTANGTDNLFLDDVSLTVTGFSQLAGSLNDMDTISLSGSPYLVTSDISFTSGTHQIEAGVVFQFMPNTAMNIGRASVNFNGTEANPILLTSNGGEGNNWNGVYFQDASDNGVSSVMNYTTIEKAGYGDNDANLRLNSTNQPVISNCTFSQADGYGMRLNSSSPVVNTCTFNNNTKSGLYLNNSSPTCTTCTMSNNSYAGIYYATTNFNANLIGITLSANKYGLYSCTPDHSFTIDESIIHFVDNDSDIAVAGGRIASNQTWNYYANGYAVLGNVEIYGGTPKLTIAPNTTIKVQSGYSIYVGRNSSEGGMLYAVGTASTPITFTSLNGEAGGWNGLNFRDGSDYNSASSLRYCVVEKATTNLYCANTNQPGILRCSFQNASSKAMELSSANITVEETVLKDSPYGLSLSSSQPTLISDTIRNTTEGCVYYANAAAAPNYYNCTLKNSPYGVRYYTPDLDLSDVENVSFENIDYKNAVNGGDIVNNRQWNVSTVAVLGNVRVGRYRYEGYRRLTLLPGTTLSFATGTGMQISYEGNVGELNAVGTEEEPITFTALNGEIGGWAGLRFTDYCDYNGDMVSVLEHCIIEKGNTYNLYMENTNQPSQINHCTFREAAGRGAYIYGATNMTDCQIMNNGSDGIYFKNSGSNMVMTDCVVYDNGGHGVKSETAYLSMHNVSLTNNGGYGMYYTNAHYMYVIDSVEIEANALGQVALDGGDITGNRTWNAYTYDILGNIRLGGSSYNSYHRLTLLPGTTLGFAEGTGMQISWNDLHGGELNAVGTAEAPIVFTALNGENGGWNGLYFHDNSDYNSSMMSVLEHCIIEKGNTYNLYMGNTNQPSQINYCTFRDALDCGVHVINGAPNISDCQVLNNGGDGIKSETAMLQLHNVTISGNGGYGMYYNNAYYMNVLENVSIEDNVLGQVALGGSDITANRTWNAYTYDILGNIRLGSSSYNSYHRLTLLPGTTLEFAEGTGMQISWNDLHGGELNALGTAEAPITFTSLDGENGGWNGLYFHDNSDYNSSMVSVLEHCIIEKGNTYNLYMDNTNQPSQINNCIFRDAQGYGVRLNNASPTIKNTAIMNNASYGLYLTGNSAPVVGASVANSCDIYLNGGFNVYQDGTANVNMRYNFMGNPDSVYVEQHLVYDQIDNSAKGKVSYMPLSFLPSNTAVSGTLLYDANPNKLITGQTLVVEDVDHNLLYAAPVGEDGGYTIPEAIGMFNTISLQPGFDVLEGVNATDALLTMRHFVHLDNLEGQHALVADVNANGIINGTDALLILRRTIDEHFPAGDYAFTADTLSFDGDVLSYPMSVLCFGDVNGSYIPHYREQTVELIHEGLLLAEPNQEVELPVRIKNVAEMGALTLRFAYPEEYLEIENVTLASTDESMLFSAADGTLKMGWYNLSPILLNEDDLLVTIKARTKDFDGLEEPISLSLSPLSELADGAAHVVADIVLSIPMIATLTLNTQENGTGATVASAIYPNPAKDQCTIAYQTQHEGRVTVSVYDVMGVKRMTLSDARVEVGNYQLQFSTSGLAAGVYYCRITLEGKESAENVIKLIVER